MAESLIDLERQRAAIFCRFAEIGDFRRGSITPTSGKCGKPSCHCAQPNDPGHGPNFRLTRKVGGKSVTETFSSPAALRKAQQEVSAFHRFQDLCQELVAVSERICALRPVEESLSPEKKKRPKPYSGKSRAN